MTGIHMTEPYTGFRAMKAGLLTNTFTEAMHVDHNKQSYADLQLSSDKDSHLEVSASLSIVCFCGMCVSTCRLFDTYCLAELSKECSTEMHIACAFE